MHGVQKEYYESGALLSETPYVNDKRHGVQKEYYENGEIKEERIYVNDELKGTINYDETGQIVENV